MGLGVRPEPDPVLAGVLGHRLDVALQDVQIDDNTGVSSSATCMAPPCLPMVAPDGAARRRRIPGLKSRLRSVRRILDHALVGTFRECRTV